MAITPEEFEKEMCEIWEKQGGDPEAAHGAMDDLMAKVLCQLGYGEGLNFWDKQEKWYA